MPWITVDPPEKKSQYRDKFVRIWEPPFAGSFDFKKGVMRPPLPFRAGEIVKISKVRETSRLYGLSRVTLKKLGKTSLELIWMCSHCGDEHYFYVPESWIELGAIGFVEERDG